MMRALRVALMFVCIIILPGAPGEAAGDNRALADSSKERLMDVPATYDDFIYLASRYADFGDFPKAFAYARRAIDLKGETADYNRVMAKIYFLVGNYDTSFSHLDAGLQIEIKALPQFYATGLSDEQYRTAREQWRIFALETFPSVIRFCIALNQMRRVKRLTDSYEAMITDAKYKVREAAGRKPVLDEKDVERGLAILEKLKKMREGADSVAARKKIIAHIRNVYLHAAGDQLMSNEKAVQEWVGFLGIIIEEFADRTGYYPSSLAELYEKETTARRPMTEMSGIDSSRTPKYHEYEFTYSPAENGTYVLSAAPLIPGKSGTKCFKTEGNNSIAIDDKCDGVIDAVAPYR